jgi:hypothetical protein
LHPGWVRTEMGGNEATLPPTQSAEGLLRVIDGAALADSGKYLDWNGEPLPW